MKLNERFFWDLRDFNDYVDAYLLSGKIITPVSVFCFNGGFRIFYTESNILIKKNNKL